MHDGAVIPSAEGDRRAVGISGLDGMPGLVSARLRLTPVAADDLAELFALHADPRAFADDLTAPLTSLSQMRWVLQQWVEVWERHGLGYFTVRAREGAGLPDGLLGVVGLSPLETDEDATDGDDGSGGADGADEADGADGGTVLSAYWRLHPAATGHGAATEAMRAVLEDPHYGPGDREVLAITAAQNHASRALAARLGFVPAAPERAVPGEREGDVLLVRPGAEPGARRP